MGAANACRLPINDLRCHKKITPALEAAAFLASIPNIMARPISTKTDGSQRSVAKVGNFTPPPCFYLRTLDFGLKSQLARQTLKSAPTFCDEIPPAKTFA
jgi:hypothetical protein